jgi:hypothetical protein
MADSMEQLAPGEGSWFLVRAIGPGGPWTYDEIVDYPGSSQFAPRGDGIDNAGSSCP